MKKGTSESSQIARIAGINPDRVIDAAYTALRGVIRIFLPFVRADIMLILVQRAVLDETEQALKQESPNVEPNLSRLALKSGLSTRMIKKVQDTTPELSVLDICAEAGLLAQWVRDPKLRDPLTGEPKELPLYGNAGTFQGLVSSHFGRGIAPTVVADRLEKSGNVKVRDRSWVQLIHPDWRWIKKEEGELLENAGNALNSLSLALVHNFPAQSGDKDKWTERRVYSMKIPAHKLSVVTKELNHHLQAQYKETVNLIRSYEDDSAEDVKEIVGAGYCFWRDEIDEP